MKKFKLFINNEWVDAENGATFDSFNPCLSLIHICFRGRQLSHTDQGSKVMDEFYNLLEDCAVKEKQAKIEGRSMFMILAPKN